MVRFVSQSATGTVQFSYPNYISATVPFMGTLGEIVTLADVILLPDSGNELTIYGLAKLSNKDEHDGIQVCIDMLCGVTDISGFYMLEGAPISGTIHYSLTNYISGIYEYQETAGGVLQVDEIVLTFDDPNGDGNIDALDVVIVAQAWNSTPGDEHWNPQADFNGDGEINIFDIVIIQANWTGNGTSGSTRLALGASSSTSTVVSLSTIESQSLHIGDVVEVDIVVDNVTNLYGFSSEITFDPTVLQVVDADPRASASGTQIHFGQFLDLEERIVVFNEANNENGTISFVASRAYPAQPDSGSGLIIATIPFTVVGEGSSAVQFTEVQLVNNTTPNPAVILANVQGTVLSTLSQRLFLPFVNGPITGGAKLNSEVTTVDAQGEQLFLPLIAQ